MQTEEERLAKKREYNSRPEVKAKQREYYKKNKERMNTQSIKWNKENKELVNQRKRKHRENNLSIQIFQLKYIDYYFLKSIVISL